MAGLILLRVADLPAPAVLLAATALVLALVDARLDTLARRVSPPPPRAKRDAAADADARAAAADAADADADADAAAAGRACEPASEALPADLAARSFVYPVGGATQPLASPDELVAIRAVRRVCAAELAGCRCAAVGSDVRVLRFLRGYATVGEAVARYREMLAWRARERLDDVAAAVAGLPLEMGSLPHGALLGACYPTTLSAGETAEGHLVSRDAIGAADVARLFRELGEARAEEWFRAFFELRALRLDAASEARGVLVQAVQIKDLDGLQLGVVRSTDGRRGLALVRRVLATATRYYPESALSLFVVNAPWFFPLVWRGLAYALPARTAAKVRVFGTEFREELGAVLGPELLGALGYAQFR
jgi:hypothetical protein